MTEMLIPDPPEGLPDTLVPLYEEARAVVEASPASACALLRLLLSALLIRQGRTGRHLNRDVNAVVAHGAPVGLLRALDAIGITEEEARNPGTINLVNGYADAQNLFMFVNLFVDQT